MHVHFGSREFLPYHSLKVTVLEGEKSSYEDRTEIIGNPEIDVNGSHGAPVRISDDGGVQHYSAWYTLLHLLGEFICELPEDAAALLTQGCLDQLERDFSNPKILKTQAEVDKYCKTFEAKVKNIAIRAGVEDVDAKAEEANKVVKTKLAVVG